MKVVKTAALVIGAVALAATGVGLALGAAGLGSALAGSAMAIGSALGVSGGLVEGVLLGGLVMSASSLAGSLQPKPSQGGEQTKWKADPYAGIPYTIGRTLVSGNIVHREGYGGSNNTYQQFTTVMSLGLIQSIDATFANRTTVTFDGGGNAIGTYHNFIYQVTQLGACPEAAALSSPIGGPADWTSAHKLSGKAAVLNTFVFDNKGKGQLTTEPKMSWIIHGVRVYDPRLDSTYPGGDGVCRALDETTYVYSADPHLNALTWALGRWQNGRRAAGLGARVAEIDVASFVEGANLNDARGWTAGGQVATRPDTSWNSMQAMLAAGGAHAVIVGGRITAINRAPRVSLATITAADIVGRCSFTGTQPRRTRINGVIPTYRSEEHDWAYVAADAVIVDDYVAIDGDERIRDLTYALVQDVDQAAALAAYDICDAREAGPGTVPLKPWWLNYKLGDCLTFEPEPGFSIKVLVTDRSIEAATGVVTYGLRGETDAKHPFALGQTGAAPPIASLDYSSGVDTPDSADWAATGTVLTDNGVSFPAVIVAGVVANNSADAVIIEMRVAGVGLGDDDGWIAAAPDLPTATRKEFTNVTPGTDYQVSVRYRVRGVASNRLILGPVTAGALVTDISQKIRSANILLSGDLLASADTGSDAQVDVAAHDWDYGDAVVTRAASMIAGLDYDTRYYIYFDDDTLADPAPDCFATLTLADAANSAAHPYRHYLGQIDTPSSGGGPTTGGGSPGGCPTAAMQLLTSMRGRVAASEVVAGEAVWGRHEMTGRWGWYPIAAISALEGQPVVTVTLGEHAYTVSASHLFERGGGWRRAGGLGGTDVGTDTVYAIEVADAHTYLLFAGDGDERGALSHNKQISD